MIFQKDREILEKPLRFFKLNVLIVDEGHKAKNTNTQFRKALKEIKVTGTKIILTGTPV